MPDDHILETHQTHVKQLPYKDVFILVGEVGERTFLYRRECHADVGSLGVVTSSSWMRLVSSDVLKAMVETPDSNKVASVFTALMSSYSS